MTCVITAFLLLSLQLFWKPRRNSTLSVFWKSPLPPGYCSAGRLFLATDMCYSSSIKHLSHTQTDSIVSELFNKHLQTANDNIIYKATKIVLLSFRPFSGLNATVDFAAAMWRHHLLSPQLAGSQAIYVAPLLALLDLKIALLGIGLYIFHEKNYIFY